MRRLGRYSLVAELARGGMGIVYLAVAPGPAATEKLFVLKTLRKDIADSDEGLTMFREEARLAARLNHPAIVHTYDVSMEGDECFLVMDYLEGVTLMRALARAPSFTLGMRLRVLCEVLDALHYAHTLVDHDGAPCGVVHRDVTPANIFLTEHGHAKLMDFGIAKALTNSSLETAAGTLKGKPGYMAPEQVKGRSSPLVDVFAVGVVLWESVAGRRLWSTKSEMEILVGLMAGNWPKLREVAPATHPVLLEIVDRATAYAPEDRFQSAEAFSSALLSFMKETGTDASRQAIGDVVATSFVKERAMRRRAIAAELARVDLRDSEESMPLPRLVSDQLVASESSRRLVARSDSVSRSDERNSGTPVRPSAIGSGPSSGSFGGTPMASALLTGGVAAPRPRRWPLVLVSAGVIVSAALAAVFAFGPNRAATTPPTAASLVAPRSDEAPRPSSPIVVPAATLFRLRVAVSPPAASIAINGALVGNPAQYPCANGEKVTIRVTAQGYESRERELRCDADEAIEFGLTAAPTVNGSPAQRFVMPAVKPSERPVPAPPSASPASPLKDLGGTTMTPGAANSPRPTVTLDTINSADVRQR